MNKRCAATASLAMPSKRSRRPVRHALNPADHGGRNDGFMNKDLMRCYGIACDAVQKAVPTCAARPLNPAKGDGRSGFD